MSPLDLILIPALAALLVPALAALAVALGVVRARATLLLVGAAFVTTVLAVVQVSSVPVGRVGFAGLVRVDPTSRLFLVTINPIFFGVSTYIWHRVRTTPALHQGIRRFVVLALDSPMWLVVAMFVVWVPVYLWGIRPALNVWASQYVSGYPAILHLVPILGLPIILGWLLAKKYPAPKQTISRD